MILLDNKWSLKPTSTGSASTHQSHTLKVATSFQESNYIITGYNSVSYNENEKKLRVTLNVDDGNECVFLTNIEVPNFPLKEAKWEVEVIYNHKDPTIPPKSKIKVVQTPGTSEPKPGKLTNKGF